MQRRHLPDKVEKQHQAVSKSLVGPHDENIQVNGDGHGPEKRACVGESGYCSLSDATHRVRVKNPPNTICVRERREPVGQREVDEEFPWSCPQVRPDDVGADDQRGAQKRQSA